MPRRAYLLICAALAAVPASAQLAAPKSAQDDLNWSIFEQLYPRRALEAREEGAVAFTVTLDNKGEVTRCQVTHTSGHPLLDQETCQIVTLHAQFKPDPNLGPSQTKTHDGIIAWKLPASLTTLQRPKPVSAAAAPEKIICKKTLRAGTLAGFERTCLAESEWAKQSDNMKQPYEDLQGKKGSTSGVSCIGPSGC